jgi:polyhydroxyalkanoate synthesis regulator protein
MFFIGRCGPQRPRGSGVQDPEVPIVLIERDAGQRLYDRDLRRYITVDDLHAWQLMSVPFIVRDAESGEDVTAAIMLEPARLH